MTTLSLDHIAAKVEEGVALSAEDAARLASTHDILTLGSLADRVRRRRHGAVTTFLRVADVSLDSAGSAPQAWRNEAREVRLVGSIGSLDEAVRAVRAVASAVAGRVPVSGFSLADLHALAEKENVPLASALGALKEAGLHTLAEVPIDALADWRGALDAAAGAGIGVARLTVDSAPGGVAALVPSLADALRLPGVSPVVAPLARRPGPAPTTGYEDVRSVALARLLLDVDHIQVDWRLHGPKLAQVALTVGADDVDNVSAEETHAEGRRRAPFEEIVRNVRAAGLDPLERDASFAPVR